VVFCGKLHNGKWSIVTPHAPAAAAPEILAHACVPVIHVPVLLTFSNTLLYMSCSYASGVRATPPEFVCVSGSGSQTCVGVSSWFRGCVCASVCMNSHKYAHTYRPV